MVECSDCNEWFVSESQMLCFIKKTQNVISCVIRAHQKELKKCTWITCDLTLSLSIFLEKDFVGLLQDLQKPWTYMDLLKTLWCG